MVAFEASELRFGHVVHLDPDILRERGDCTTNAQKEPVDRAVKEPHYFLVLKVEEDSCTAAPLYSKPGGDKDHLDEALKTGLANNWIGVPSYTHRRQQWRIPLAAIEAASGEDNSDSANRRRYAADKPEVLDCILSWETENLFSYRPV